MKTSTNFALALACCGALTLLFSDQVVVSTPTAAIAKSPSKLESSSLDGDKLEMPILDGDKLEMPILGGDKLEMPILGGDKLEMPILGGDKLEMPILGGDKLEMPILGKMGTPILSPIDF